MKAKDSNLKKVSNGSNSKDRNSTAANSQKHNDKNSPKSKDKKEHRPRRRASQTHFFKYQLACNPLKVEEEDLKKALIASLQQCGNVSATTAVQKKRLADESNRLLKKSKKQKLLNGTNNDCLTSEPTKSNGLCNKPKLNGNHKNGFKLKSKKEFTKSTAPKKKKKQEKLQNGDVDIKDFIQTSSMRLQNNCHSQDSNSTNSKTGCSNNGSKSNKKFSALRKFASNSTHHSYKGKLNVPHIHGSKYNKQTSIDKLDDYATSASSIISNSRLYFSHPDNKHNNFPNDEYLKKYKPDTGDFLTFICFRETPPHFEEELEQNIPKCPNGIKIESSPDGKGGNNTCTNSSVTSNVTSTNNLNNNNKLSTASSTPQRRPTRHSLRLSSNRKISENDNNIYGASSAYENSTSYEEDMKKACIALEDMAQEINSLDDVTNEVAQEPDLSLDRHLVKGLISCEFAGAFADEETMFDSISNHKL